MNAPPPPTRIDDSGLCRGTYRPPRAFHTAVEPEPATYRRGGRVKRRVKRHRRSVAPTTSPAMRFGHAFHTSSRPNFFPTTFGFLQPIYKTETIVQGSPFGPPVAPTPRPADAAVSAIANRVLAPTFVPPVDTTPVPPPDPVDTSIPAAPSFDDAGDGIEGVPHVLKGRAPSASSAPAKSVSASSAPLGSDKTCPFCGETFSTVKGTRVHISKVHREMKAAVESHESHEAKAPPRAPQQSLLAAIRSGHGSLRPRASAPPTPSPSSSGAAPTLHAVLLEAARKRRLAIEGRSTAEWDD